MMVDRHLVALCLGAVVTLASLALAISEVLLAYRSPVEYMAIQSHVARTRWQKTLTNVRLAAFVGCVGVFGFHGAITFLWWMPESWGRVGEDGDWQPLKALIALAAAIACVAAAIRCLDAIAERAMTKFRPE